MPLRIDARPSSPGSRCHEEHEERDDQEGEPGRETVASPAAIVANRKPRRRTEQGRADPDSEADPERGPSVSARGRELELEPDERARVLRDLLAARAPRPACASVAGVGIAPPVDDLREQDAGRTRRRSPRRGTDSGRRRPRPSDAAEAAGPDGATGPWAGFSSVGASPFARARIRLGLSLRREAASSARGWASFAFDASPCGRAESASSLQAGGGAVDELVEVRHFFIGGSSPVATRQIARRETAGGQGRDARETRVEPGPQRLPQHCVASLPRWRRNMDKTAIAYFSCSMRSERRRLAQGGAAEADHEHRRGSAWGRSTSCWRRSRAAGCRVTQATISRDIRELGLDKATTRWAAAVPGAAVGAQRHPRETLLTAFSRSSAAASAAQNIVVVQSELGSARRSRGLSTGWSTRGSWGRSLVTTPRGDRAQQPRCGFVGPRVGRSRRLETPIRGIFRG